MVSQYRSKEQLAKDKRDQRKHNAELLRKDPSIVKHGTLNAYDNYGCRCDECRANHSRVYKQRPIRKSRRK
jgi:hypothetical protein